MTEPVPTYHIKSVRDFLKVPADRRDTCLREFAVWLAMDEMLRAVAEGLPVKLPAAFVWIDDGKHHASATIAAGGERIPVISGTIKGFEDE